MPFSHSRTIRLADTDAAGFVYFARTLSICHEAYEESLATTGVDVNELLGAAGIIVPIARSEADYLRPLRAGDKVRIDVTPEGVSPHSFVIRFEIVRLGRIDKVAARVRTEHVCTSSTKRERVPLPPSLLAWIEKNGRRPL